MRMRFKLVLNSMVALRTIVLGTGLVKESYLTVKSHLLILTPRSRQSGVTTSLSELPLVSYASTESVGHAKD